MKSAISGLGRVLYSVVILLLSVLASRFFSVEWYSLFREYFMYFIIGITVSAIPLTNPIYYFPSRSFSSYSKMLLISLAVLLITFSVLFAVKSTDVLYFSFITALSSTLFLSLEALFLSLKRVRLALILNAAESLSLLLPIIPVVIQGSKEPLFFISVSLLSLAKIPVYLALIFLFLRKSHAGYGFGEILSFSSPLYLNGLFGAFSKQSDKYIVSILCSQRAFASYSTGAFEFPLVARFFGGVFHERGEAIRSLLLAGEEGRVREMLDGIIKKTFPVLSVFTLFMFANSKLIMEGIFTPEYADSYRFFSVYLAALPLRVFPFGFLLSLKGKTRRILLVSLLDAALTLILSFAFLKLFGIYFVAFAFLSGTLLSAALLSLGMRGMFPARSFFLRYSVFLAFILFECLLSTLSGNALLTNAPAMCYLLCFMAKEKFKK